MNTRSKKNDRAVYYSAYKNTTENRALLFLSARSPTKVCSRCLKTEMSREISQLSVNIMQMCKKTISKMPLHYRSRRGLRLGCSDGLSERVESDRAQSFTSANETRRYYLTAKHPLPQCPSSQFSPSRAIARSRAQLHAARSAITRGGVDRNRGPWKESSSYPRPSSGEMRKATAAKDRWLSSMIITARPRFPPRFPL